MNYLDNSATTRPCPEAIDAMLDSLKDNWANPSSLYSFGMRSAKQLRESRQAVANALVCEPNRVFFTSGGTESDNWAIYGTIKRYRKRGMHIITSEIEHPAILNCMRDLEQQGFEVTYLKPDEKGIIQLDSLKAALRKDTILVSIMMVNNEVGSLMSIAEMAKYTHKYNPEIVFHTDAVQSFLKVPFKAKSLGADLISISSHKVHGPKGVGALYISPRLKSFPPLIQGGGQESGYRSGTEATPAIAGFAAACRTIGTAYLTDSEREHALIQSLADSLSSLDGVYINGVHAAPHILSVSIPGVPTQNSINILQDAGICVSAGSACAKGHRSHVLSAMHVPPERIDSSFRISICRDTTPEELREIYEVIRNEILPRVKH